MARWLLVLALLIPVGCGDDDGGDECATSAECEMGFRCVNGACVPEDVDAGSDAGTDAGQASGPASAAITSGGSTVLQNSEYRLRISVGAPVPTGQASNSSYRLRIGPQSR